MSKVILKRSSVPNKVPLAADLDYGELAINYADGIAYFKRTDNTIGTIGGASSFSQSNRYTYTATSGQQEFVALYDFGRIDVYLNGVKQVLDSDFTANTGTTISFTEALIAGDIVDIVSYNGSNDIPPLPGTDIVGINDTQTLTNKTLNSPTINNAIINSWSEVPQWWFKGQLSTDTSTTGGIDNTISWNNNSEPQPWYNSGNKRITPGMAGWYEVLYKITLAGISNSNQQNTQIRVNDSNVSIAVNVNTTNNYQTITNTGMFYLGSPTDYFTFTVWTPADQTMQGGTQGCSVIVRWISR